MTLSNRLIMNEIDVITMRSAMVMNGKYQSCSGPGRVYFDPFTGDRAPSTNHDQDHDPDKSDTNGNYE